MKVAWCTPFNVKSAIGHFSFLMAKELTQRHHDVTIFSTETEDLSAAPIECDLPVREIGILKQSHDSDFDVVIYNIGDHYPYHSGILELLEQKPGIGIFHDCSIVNLFYGYVHARGIKQSEWERILVETHGPSGPGAFRDYSSGSLSLEDAVKTVPMLSWLSSKVWAAVAHSGFYVEDLAKTCPGPVTAIHLAYQPKITLHEMQQPSPLAGKIRLLTIGRVNANKCYEEVIRAIGLSDSLKASCSYIIAGSYETSYGAHILQLARGLGVTVQLVGEVSDTELAQLMVEADIVCCLRKPVLEGGSASAIEALHSGKPVIVADAGFYSELPDEFLIKVPPIVEPSAVAAVLTSLSRDLPAAKRAAARSREWANKYFAPSRYCDEIEKFMDEFVAAKPLLDLGWRIGKQLAEIGLQPDDPIIESIAVKIDELFRLET